MTAEYDLTPKTEGETRGHHQSHERRRRAVDGDRARRRVRARDRPQARSQFRHRRGFARPLRGRRGARPADPVGLVHAGAGQRRRCSLPGSRTDLGRTVTGVAIKEGATPPDISTPEAFKQALLNARGVSYTDPKAGGSSGNFFAGLLESSASPTTSTRRPCWASAAMRWRRRRRRPRRDRHHLHQRNPDREGGHRDRPAAGRSA